LKNPLIISTAAYDGYDLEVAFREIAAAGVELVEVAFIEGYTDPFTEDYFSEKNAVKISKLLAEYKLACMSFSSHVDLAREGIVDIFKKRMAFAHKLGARYIISNAAPLNHKHQFMENIAQLGQAAADLEMIIALENPGDGHPNVIDSAEPAARTIEEIGLASVKINYDFGNLLSHCFGKLRPEHDYKLVIAQTAHFHIKDVAANDSGWYFTEIGRGTIDYQRVLGQLAAVSDVVPLSLEIPLRVTRAPDASPRRALQPVELAEIRRVMTGSVDFVKKSITAHSGRRANL
jgi:sugar phosphate isomerase/epimerase